MNKQLHIHDLVAALLIIGMFVGNSIYNTTVPLFGDEAYYWLWSKHLALSYYDHPPMVAYLIKLTTILGTSVFSVRLMPVICFSVGSVFLYLLAKKLFNERIALLSLIISLALPATQMGYTLATDDAPLIMFWVISLYFGYRAITENKTKLYITTGVFMGLALLSKYTAIFIPATFFLYLLTKEPRKLFTWKPWLSVIISFTVFSPVIYWNYTHHWISFIFQYRHGTGARIGLNDILQFLGGIIVLLTPIFFIIYAVSVFKPREWIKNRERYFTMISALTVFIFFFYKGMFKMMEINWYAPAAIGATVYVAWFIHSKHMKRTLTTGLLLALLMSLAMKFPLFLHIPPKYNLQNRLFGYTQAIKEYSTMIKPRYKLCADYLTTASLMSFYLPGHPTVYSPFSKRTSMLSMWYKNKPKGSNCLVLSQSKKEIFHLKKHCLSFKLLKRITITKQGFLPKRFFVYICKGVK